MVATVAYYSSVAKNRTDALSSALQKMEKTTNEAYRCCDQLTKRACQLDSLTSPASDSSSMLSRANANLAATIVLMKDARDKFDTVSDCEPAIERLHKGVEALEEKRKSGRKGNVPGRVILSEQDVYGAGDSMEIIRDAYEFFAQRPSWRSAPPMITGLERVYEMGLVSMSLLITSYLKSAGQAVRAKRRKDSTTAPVPASEETAQQTRARLAAALQNRDLLKSIGDWEEVQPIEARPIREMRAIFECLGSHGYQLGANNATREPPGLGKIYGIPAHNIVRTEKVGSGCYSNLVKEPLKTGFPQIDAYGQARRDIAFAAMDSYYRRIKTERKRRLEKAKQEHQDSTEDFGLDEADEAARDAVRCLEHAMVLAAGEKSVYRTIVSPSIAAAVAQQQAITEQKEENEAAAAAGETTAKPKSNKEVEDEREEMSPYLKKACAAAYSYIVGAVVDRTLDIIETVFLKEGGIGQTSGASKGGGDGHSLTVQAAASAAAAGLRILDGVRMLGPSLAKLCEMPVGDGKTDPNTSVAAILCIGIHRTAVKNTARTLENLAKSIQDDPLKGPLHRPKDASVSTVSSDVVRAIRLVSPYVSAYKSVSKRRALPWDPNMGEEAGELDAFVRFLVMRLLNSLKGKALNYTRDGRDDSQAKSNLFMLNNSFYVKGELATDAASVMQMQMNPSLANDAEHYRIEGSWFVDKINKIMESEKTKYLGHWEILNTHLTAVGSNELEYQKGDSVVLTHDSGKLIKQRFSGFNEDFIRTYTLHKKLCIVDPRLRLQLQEDVSNVFMPRYRRFFEKYTKVRFSKKKQDEYTKYSPDKIEDMLADLYTDPE